MSEFSDRIVSIRKSKGISQKHLAEILDIGVTRLNYWEKGKREPNVEMIKKIASALNVTPDFLLGINVSSRIENLTEKEEKIIRAYRENTEMQIAIDKLLGID